MSAVTMLVEDDIESIVYGYLRERFPALADCDADTPLIETGALDSLGFLELMMFLSEKFGIELTDDDFDPSNLETPGSIIAFIRRNTR
ncbi:acyl carrier protein [Devosia sp.]|uniref:acyl carrier protein n=1 Tax=Devosia sp. TaxID=1871048 RepID=UPI0025C227E3|nr:acyl carrier protein [Devosia sp.]